MRKGFLTASAGFILLFSAIYFFDDRGILAALIPAVLAHEAGHCLCLRAFGARLKSIRLDLTGVSLSYAGAHMTLIQELCATIAGPVCGLVYAFAASWLSSQWRMSVFSLSAGISFVLSIFNLLPAMPLDGGRALLLILHRLHGRRSAAKIQYIMGLVISLILLIGGIWCVDRGFGCALILSGIWLLMAASEDACKIRDFVIQ